MSKAASKLSSVYAKKKRWKKRPKPYNAPKPEDLDVVLGKWKVRKEDLARVARGQVTVGSDRQKLRKLQELACN